MKNRVNLYPRELQPRFELMTPGLVLSLWLVAALAVGLFSWHANSDLQSLQARQQALAGQLTGLRTQVRLEVQRLDKEPSETLVTQIQALQGKIAAQQQVLGMLAQRDRRDKVSYAALMRDLANHHHPDIWLTHMQISGEQISLQGGTRTSEALPRWLSGLSDARSMAGTEFASVQLIRDERDGLSFLLTSSLAAPLTEAPQ